MSMSIRAVNQRISNVRSSDLTTLGHGVRYVLAGGFVALVYFATTTILAGVFTIPFQLALIGGTAVAVGVHFTLQRLFVWTRKTPYALGIGRQMARYALVVVCQYAITAITTSLLPGPLGVPALYVYFAVSLALAITNFLFFRNRVFHAVG